MILLEGKPVAEKIRKDVQNQIKAFEQKFKKKPKLSVVLIGEDPASKVYVKHKIKACEELGLDSQAFYLEKNVSQEKLNSLIKELNLDKSINGILVQMPLPQGLDYFKVLDLMDPIKDVDGLTPQNVGLAWAGRARVHPCTPAGIIELLEHYRINVERKEVVVVGRSEIVGKPMAGIFLEKNATVTICHSKTKALEDVTKRGEIVVCAVGKRNFFTKEYFDKDAVVIDVGIHRLEEGLLCGDVFFKDVKDHVRAITPVPGGVGPLTIAQLMKNTLILAELQENKEG